MSKRPKSKVSKSDPHYQPTKAEMNADISVPDATPEALATSIFKGVGQPAN